ncbi:uncharacterized protein LOC135223296 [Macrobrachium nipponense]|uniref:uncharacterized protein LOC135223296 n=1 Tax=Macrobrachium nipponense TaxID=159736 RepID=UPI0030C8943D
MAPKRENTASDGSATRRRKTISLEMKYDIVKRSLKGENNTDIGRALGLSRTTVQTIVKAKERVLQHMKGGASMMAGTHCSTYRIGKQHNTNIIEMERLLMVWLEDQNQRNVPVSYDLIREKALELHEAVVLKRGKGSESVTFAASKGWFHRFRSRANLHKHLNVNGAWVSPNFVMDFPGFEKGDSLDAVQYSIKVKMEVEADVTEVLQCYGEELSADYLFEPKQQMIEDEEDEEAPSQKAQLLSPKSLSHPVAHIGQGLAISEEKDPNVERSTKLRRTKSLIQSTLELYGFKILKSPEPPATPNGEEKSHLDNAEPVMIVPVVSPPASPGLSCHLRSDDPSLYDPPASPTLSEFGRMFLSDDTASLAESFEGFPAPSTKPPPASTGLSHHLRSDDHSPWSVFPRIF